LSHIFRKVLDFYLHHNTHGERFAEILHRVRPDLRTEFLRELSGSSG
jgi:hypothetical protein